MGVSQERSLSFTLFDPMNRNGHTTLPPNSSLVSTNVQPNWVFPAVEDPSPKAAGFTITIPPNMASRRSSRLHPDEDVNASGSEYHASNASMDVDEHPVPIDDDEEPEEEVVVQTSKRGRKTKHKSYVESSATEDELNVIDKQEDEDVDADANGGDEDDDDAQPGRRVLRSRAPKRGNLNGAIMSDDEGETQVGRYSTRSKSKPSPSGKLNGHSGGGRLKKSSKKQRKAAAAQSLRRTRSNAKDEVDENYIDEPADSASGDDSVDDIAETSDLEPSANDAEPGADADAEGEPEETDERPYALRQRNKVNYAIPPPIEEMSAPPSKPRSKGKNGRSYGRPKAPGWSATGAQLDRWLGGAGDDSVSVVSVHWPSYTHDDRSFY